MLRAQGDLAGALHVYRAVLVMWQRLAAADPANIEWHHNLSTSHFRIGDVLIDQGNFGEAAKHFSAAQTAASSLIELDPSNPEFRSLAEQAKAGSLSLKFYSIPVRIFFMITFLCLSGGAVTLALRGGYLWLLAGLLGVCSMIPAALFFLPTIHRLSRRNHFKRKRRRTDENRRA
jgi:hypothetical protein